MRRPSTNCSSMSFSSSRYPIILSTWCFKSLRTYADVIERADDILSVVLGIDGFWKGGGQLEEPLRFRSHSPIRIKVRNHCRACPEAFRYRILVFVLQGMACRQKLAQHLANGTDRR